MVAIYTKQLRNAGCEALLYIYRDGGQANAEILA